MKSREFCHYLKSVNERLDYIRGFHREVDEIKSLLDQLFIEIENDLEDDEDLTI